MPIIFKRTGNKPTFTDAELATFANQFPDDTATRFTIAAALRSAANAEFASRAQALADAKDIAFAKATEQLARTDAGRALLRMTFAPLAFTAEADLS